MDWKTGGALAFGIVIGWYVYYVNRYRKGDVQISDITSLIGAIGGAAILALFQSGSDLFGAYGVGLAIGFFGYFFVLIILVEKSQNFDSDWFLDGRRKNPTGDFGYGTEVQRPMAVRQALAVPSAAPQPAAEIVSAMRRGPDPNDPASPGRGDVSETADFDTARILTNLGAGAVEVSSPVVAAAAAAGPPTIAIDIAGAQQFLHACETSHPRVTYGLGAKVPFHGAVPGQDFQQVDCSGFVREAIWRATDPHFVFPDGSVVQHDWVKSKGFRRGTVADGGLSDNHVRIAFLPPQASSDHVGHVVLLSGGKTIESHSGIGPDSRPWTGQGWQAQTFVYVLT